MKHLFSILLFAVLTITAYGQTANNDTSKDLPRSNPKAENVDIQGINNFLKDMGDRDMDLHSLMIVRNGKVVFEKWLGDNSPSKPHTMYSVSKTYTATAIGFAVSEGKLKVSDKVISFFPDKLPQTISDNLKALEIRHLLTMTSGHDVEPGRGSDPNADWLEAFFAAPFEHEPGTFYVYNSMATYVLSAIIQKVTGEKLIDYLQTRLFNPLGIVGATWSESPQGICVGGWGLSIKTEDMAKLGQFILQKGLWDGKQLLPPSWFDEATAAQVESLPAGARKENLTMEAADSDWLQGYGYQMWRCRHNAFRADGAYGQFIIIIPEKDAVVAITAKINDMQAELNLVWEHLLPAMEGNSVSAFGQGENPDSPPLIYVIDIDSEINTTSRIILRKGLDEANQLAADAVLLHLNTYGGAVLDADSMRSAILYNPVPVYVFIDNNAASAGALISIACDKIFMRKGANIGAATVVNSADGEAMPDKYQSYMRSMMRSTAEARGRDPLIAEAMVDDRVVIPGISEEGKTLTFTAQEALKHGFCDGIAESVDEVITTFLDYPRYELKEYKPTFMDKLKGFLTNPAFQAILIMIIVAGIYFELQSPGIGFPTAAAIIAAILYFTPLYLDGLVQNWEIIIFILGIILILLEIFIIPGFGIAGITGIILIGMGFVFAMLDNDYFNFENVEIPDVSGSVLTVLSGMLLSFLIILWISSRIGKKGMFRKIALEADLTDSGSVDKKEFDLIGQTGTAMTDLRPSGRIMIANEVYDAVSNQGYIEKGSTVTVVKFENMQLHVESV